MPDSNLREVYIAQIEMSSPNAIAEHEELDDMHVKNTLQYSKEVRARIVTTRNKNLLPINKECLRFHGLRVIRGDSRVKIADMVEQADAEMKAIAPELFAHLTLIPISVDAQAKGVLWESLTAAIRGQVYTSLLERLKLLAGKENVPMRSRKALLDLCDKMGAWNVLGDPNVTETIATYRRMFEEGIIAPVAEEVQKAVDAATNAAAFVEV